MLEGSGQVVQKPADMGAKGLAEVKRTAVKQPVEVCLQFGLCEASHLERPHEYPHTADNPAPLGLQAFSQVEVVCQRHIGREPCR